MAEMTREEWATALLEQGGWVPTQEHLVGVVAWASAENSGALANPLDTTEPAPRATDYNSVGVKNYPSTEAGLSATLATLHNGYYPGILATLGEEGSSALQLSAAVAASPWGTGAFPTIVESIKAGDPYGYRQHPVAGTESAPAPPAPTPLEDEMFGNLAKNEQDDFNASTRLAWWIAHGDTEPTAEFQNLLWDYYRTPEPEGAGGSMDLVLARLRDYQPPK